MKWYSIKGVLCLSVAVALPTHVVAWGNASVPSGVSDTAIRHMEMENSDTMLTDTLCEMSDTLVAMPDSVIVSTDTLTVAPPSSHYRYEKRTERAMRSWSKLIPTTATLQYAGSIGLMSAGIGWHYGRGSHWETELLAGFLPKYNSEAAHFTFTVKERYVAWHVPVSSRWTLEPLTAGFFFNTISGEDFWRKEPSRYPKRYYGFSTKVRTHIFLGQRFKYRIPRKNRIFHQYISAYYEFSTCDLYLVSKCTNKEYPWNKTLSLAFGLRWEM